MKIQCYSYNIEKQPNQPHKRSEDASKNLELSKMMTTSRALWSILCFQVLIGKATPKESNTNNIRGGEGIADFNRDTQEFGGARSSLGLVEDEEVEDPSEKESFPFLASLMDDGFNHICGGTLIATDMILTAASCEDRA